MTLKPVPVIEAARMKRAGVPMVDVRRANEFARAHIPDAVNHPLKRIDGTRWAHPVVFVCRAGALGNADLVRLAECSSKVRSYFVEGGFAGWRREGLPVQRGNATALDLVRQSKLAAGLLVLTGLFLGWTVGAAWLVLSTVTAVRLTVAGLSGWCGMALVLERMPWSRRALG